MKLSPRLVTALFSAAAAAAALTATPTAAAQQVPAALSNVVFLGDSLTAGMQNGSLSVNTQVHGWPYLVAQQAGFPIVEPWVAAPGIPNEMTLTSAKFPYTFGTVPGQSTGRINVDQQATNLGVPGANAWTVLFGVPTSLAGNGQYAATNLVLGYPVGSNLSEVNRAVAMQPSTVFLFIGGMDLIPGVLLADPSQATPPANFSQEFAYILYILKTQTNANVIVATVPDVTLLPLVAPAPVLSQEVATYTGQPASAVQQELGLQTTDSVNEAGIEQVEVSLLTNGPSAALSPLGAGNVLSQSAVMQLRSTAQAYNQDIQFWAGLFGAQVVDIYGTLNSLQSGATIDGKELTLGYLGGFFSIDGLHLTNTGYAITANAFIAGMNSALNLSVPPVDVNAIASSDPLFPGAATQLTPTAATGPSATAMFSMPY